MQTNDELSFIVGVFPPGRGIRIIYLPNFPYRSHHLPLTYHTVHIIYILPHTILFIQLVLTTFAPPTALRTQFVSTTFAYLPHFSHHSRHLYISLPTPEAGLAPGHGCTNNCYARTRCKHDGCNGSYPVPQTRELIPSVHFTACCPCRAGHYMFDRLLPPCSDERH